MTGSWDAFSLQSQLTTPYKGCWDNRMHV